MLALVGMALAGCSSITGSGTTQSVSVQALNAGGVEVTGARCSLQNDVGSWFVTTPGSVTINRSNKDLFVKCTKEGLENGEAKVVSSTKCNMFGNLIFGGGIGAIIDHNNGSAYEYPGLIKVSMGQNTTISK